MTIFRGIQATDRDKPNTPNSDVQYSLTAGDTQGRFALENSHRALLIVKKPLDYDSGDREFQLTITATVCKPNDFKNVLNALCIFSLGPWTSTPQYQYNNYNNHPG